MTKYVFLHIPSGKICDMEPDGIHCNNVFDSVEAANKWSAESVPQWAHNYRVIPMPEGVKSAVSVDEPVSTMHESSTLRLTTVQDWNPHKQVQYRARVSRRANEYGEYVTRYYADGVYMGEDCDDYQMIYDDALATARAIIKYMCESKE